MKPQNEANQVVVFGDYQPQAPKFKGVTRQSLYLHMRDGIKIAVEVVLPKNRSLEDKIPALLSQTRYWRTMELNLPFKWFLRPDMLDIRLRGFQSFFTSQGYALV